jgi:multidrug efflux pump subunit AcrA (membrane-fusion protein)
MRRKLFVNGALGAATVGILVAGWASLGSPTRSSAAVATAQVTRGIVLSSVSATGNVAADRTIGLDFGSSGRVTDVLVQPGDQVQPGQVLARIDPANATTSLDLAQANLTSAEAKLSDAKAGLTPAERAQLDISEEQAAAQVTSAQQALTNARANATQDAKSLQAAVDQAKANIDAVRATASMSATQYQAAVDQSTAQSIADQAQYLTDQSTLATTSATLLSAQATSDTDNAKVTAEQSDKSYCQANPSGTGPNSGVACNNLDSQTVVDQAAQSRATSALNDAKSAYNAASSAITSDRTKQVSDQNSLTNTTNTQAAGLLRDAQSVTNAQTAYANAQTNQSAGLLKDQQAVGNAETSLASAQLAQRATKAGDLVKLEPAKAAELASDEAAVISARSSLGTAQQAVADTTLVAPAAATVASVSGAVGDAVTGGSSSASSGSSAAGSSGGTSAGASSASSSTSSSSSSTSGFIVLTDLRTLKVTAGFSEADAAKVHVGQAAVVSFDALPDQTASGQVVTVDPTSTVVNNVVTYNVTVLLTQAVKAVKPGMTASVQVVVNQQQDALKVPSSAVSTRGGQSTVTLRSNGKDVVRSVVVGLVGDDSTEVVSGLKQGDVVVTGGGGAPTAAGAAGGARGATGGAGTLTGGGAVPGGGGGGFGGGGR